jgi:alkylation response protein AidB-like acyl-CoA dehydrogenase
MLDAAEVAGMPAARAAASELAYRCATTLVVATGAQSIVAGEPAQKLLREAAFLLVFGSRPSIREHLLRRVSTRD